MLTKISLINFKSARDLQVPLKQISVLSGLNGSGKSTILQAICLLKQSQHENNSQEITKLHLRGSLIQLGLVEDVLSDNAQGDEITIEIQTKQEAYSWTTAKAKPQDSILLVRTSSGSTPFFDHGFQYLQADRLVPQSHYERSSNSNLGFLGEHGQFTPDFLAQNADLEVPFARHCQAKAMEGITQTLYERIAVTSKLYDQIGGWLQYLSPGVRLNATHVEKTDLARLTYSYALPQIGQDSRERRPTNVGFGLTYCLPILTACLVAPKGSLLLIENPEAHLHPKGQAAMGALLAKCASDGVQIIVETHSDHVLNGIRLAVKHREIRSNQVQLCNFTRDIQTGNSYIETPQILDNGELTTWPDGYFDQWEKSLEALLIG